MLSKLPRGMWPSLLVISVGLLLWPVGRAAGQQVDPPAADHPPERLSDWKINDEDPEKSVPTLEQANADPMQFGYYLMDLSEKAGQASKRGDHSAAAKFWSALAKAVPDRSFAFSKACASYETIGEWGKAVEACRAALGREGVTLADSIHFVHLVLDKRTALDPVEIDDLSEVVTNLKREPSTRTNAEDLGCEIALRLEEVKRLEECTAALNERAPNDPKTISHAWALAIKRKDLVLARHLIDRARAASVPPEAIVKMEQATRAAEPLWRKAFRDWRFFLGLGVVVAAGLVVLTVGRRRSLMRAA